VLLLVDNASGHPKDLHHLNVKVIFLPSNTTSLIQPIDQGIIATFKANYIRRTFQAILEKLDDDPALTLTMVWKSFTILDCVNNVAAAKEEVRKSTLNCSWRNIWPSVVLEKNQALPALEDEYQRIINLALSVGGEGFEDLAVEELRELTFESELNETDLIDLLTDAN
jgi:hypothetical protein